MMKHGRKFAITAAGLFLTSALAVVAMVLGVAEPTAAVGSIGVMVAAFNAGNAWATNAHAPKGDA